MNAPSAISFHLFEHPRHVSDVAQGPVVSPRLAQCRARSMNPLGSRDELGVHARMHAPARRPCSPRRHCYRPKVSSEPGMHLCIGLLGRRKYVEGSRVFLR